MSANELIDKAIELIEDRGWIKGYFENQNGFCIVGALQEAQTLTNQLDFNTYSIVRSNLEKILDMSALAWNDHECLSKDEAIAALKKIKE